MICREDPISILSDAIASAQYKDLPDIIYKNRDWDAYIKAGKPATIASDPKYLVDKIRRPIKGDFVVYAMFPEIWGSGALGFGGMGTAAVVTCYTVVIEFKGNHYIYWAGRFAYEVNLNNLPDNKKQEYMELLKKNRTLSIKEYKNKILETKD